MKVGIVIQARMGSSRLPGKIVKEFFEQKSILDILIEGVISVFKDEIKVTIATSVEKANDYLQKYLSKYENIEVYRGSENDVLQRFIEVGTKNDYSHVVRVCADNPFLNIASIQELLSNLTSDTDYISFKNYQAIPAIKTHWGLYAEVVSLEALRKVKTLTSNDFYFEHVTNFIYENANLFNVKFLKSSQDVYQRDDIRLTIDDELDFINIKKLYSETFPNSQDLSLVLNTIDSSMNYKETMRKGIEKYSK